MRAEWFRVSLERREPGAGTLLVHVLCFRFHGHEQRKLLLLGRPLGRPDFGLRNVVREDARDAET